MRIILQLSMVILIMLFTGCTSSETNPNSNVDISNEQKELVEEKEANEQPTADDSSSVFSLRINDASITLHDWDHEIKLEEILGPPVTQNVEELKNADTHTGSLIKKLEYDGLQIELFSPKQNGETFWIRSIEVSKEGYKTSKGIEIGDTMEEVKNAYPGIEMVLDGRTDPNNAAYEISDEVQNDHLQFEINEGLVSQIKIFNLVP